MADATTLRQQAERCRKVANTSYRKKPQPNPYLRDLAEHFEQAADAAEALERGGDKPKAAGRY
jgi:hypothetical protein